MRISSPTPILIIASVIISLAISSPVLLRSTSSLTQLKNDYFMDSNTLVQNIINGFAQSKDVPEVVYVFEVIVNDPDLIKTNKMLSSTLNKLSYLKGYFSDNEHAYVSNYVNYDSPKEIGSRLFNGLFELDPQYKEFSASLKDLMNGQAQIFAGNSKKIVYTVPVGLNDLPALEKFLMENKEKNALVCLLFDVKQQISEFHQIRLLQATDTEGAAADTEAPTADTEAPPAGTGTTTTDAEGEEEEEGGNKPISVGPNGLSGILITLSVIPIFLVGLSCLCNIQSPSTFVKSPLIIGKEDI